MDLYKYGICQVVNKCISTKGSKKSRNKETLTLKNAIRLKIIITVATYHRNQNRQAQRTLTNRKKQKINDKEQAIAKTTQIKINRKIKN
jgi:hypothetical protein